MNKYLVTITIINKKGNTKEIKFETDTLISATRIILTYKPIRNYETVEYLVTPLSKLV